MLTVDHSKTIDAARPPWPPRLRAWAAWAARAGLEPRGPRRGGLLRRRISRPPRRPPWQVARNASPTLVLSIVLAHPL
eukprot:1227984-Pyramimonas_sp.AAC.1